MPSSLLPRLLRRLAVLSFALVLVPAARAQMPTQGDFYEDSVDLGFKVRVPKGWVFAPPQPGEPNTIGTYEPPFNKYVNISSEELLPLTAHLVKFDRRPKPEEPEAVSRDDQGRVVVDTSRLRRRGHETLTAYVESRVYGNGAREIEKGEFRIKGVEATEHLFRATALRGAEFYIWAVLYKPQPDLDVALIFTAPSGKSWRQWQGNLRRMGQTFQTLEVRTLGAAAGQVGDSAYRTQKRNQLALEVARNPGWSLDETPNYFIISAVQDPAFMRELKLRLEAIRSVYEELYPAEQAERIRLLAKQRETGAKDGAGEKKEGEDGADEPEVVFRTTTGATPQELSRCSVVRVCANQQQYHQYGGPGGSAGYWNWGTEELVIFDDKAGGGRRDTWAVLNHEAFHQYIFYFYGNISPHSWYNEGTGDFFSGYQLKNNRFVLSRFDWRLRTIQQAIREKKDGKNTFAPLRDLVRFTQSEYYGNNKYNLGGGENYAQGWSFIYFLRTGKGKARGWNNAWDGILDTYLETLAATRDLDKSVDVAFAGVDWEALETAWMAYTLN